MRRTTNPVILLLTIALIASACAAGTDATGDDEPVTTAPDPTTTEAPSTTTTHAMHETSTTVAGDADGARVIDVVMTDLAFDPEQIDVAAGETVKFNISNDGAVDHEFRLSNAHRIEVAFGRGPR